RWPRVREIFERAIALPPRERAEFVRNACEGDHALAADVAALLEAYEAEDGAVDALVNEVGAAGRSWLAGVEEGLDERPTEFTGPRGDRGALSPAGGPED